VRFLFAGIAFTLALSGCGSGKMVLSEATVALEQTLGHSTTTFLIILVATSHKGGPAVTPDRS
jgi:hypothetical protein